jgi:hypothetical protein
MPRTLFPRNYDETVQEAINGLHFLLREQRENVSSLQPYALLAAIGTAWKLVFNRNIY